MPRVTPRPARGQRRSVLGVHKPKGNGASDGKGIGNYAYDLRNDSCVQRIGSRGPLIPPFLPPPSVTAASFIFRRARRHYLVPMGPVRLAEQPRPFSRAASPRNENLHVSGISAPATTRRKRGLAPLQRRRRSSRFPDLLEFAPYRSAARSRIIYLFNHAC